MAVVGASRDPSSVGHRVLTALLTAGFRGAVYPVNPAAAAVANLTAYPSVRALPPGVDLAIVAVPAACVPAIVDDCAASGVRALVILSAGFSETGADGRARQDALVAQARAQGIRIVGPNCMGLLNTAASVRLNATFSPVFPPDGHVGFLSHSGALGISILALAAERGIGVSTFVSAGNSADVAQNDVLEYWEQDEATRVVLLYLEAIEDPRRLMALATRISHVKPIVALKAGRTAAGTRAAASHTAALAARDVGVDALFHQAGVIRADTLDDMFDIVTCLDLQPLPSGRRVGIVTNAGGPGILAADACVDAGLVVTATSPETRTSLATALPALAALQNPVDMVASAGGREYAHTIETMAGASEIDALIVIFTPVDVHRSAEILQGIRDGVARYRQSGQPPKPILACLMAPADRTSIVIDGGQRLPTYRSPEHAVRALGKIARYAEWRRQAPSREFPCDWQVHEDAQSICARAHSARGTGWLTSDETRKVLAAGGISLIDTRLARTAAEAVHMAESLGFPVAAKLSSHLVTHKTDVGGVHLNLADADAVALAFAKITSTAQRLVAADAIDGVQIQRMAPHGIEVLVGAVRDPLFGPLIAFGLGGTLVELLADVHFRLAPLTAADIDALLRQGKVFSLLSGFRGNAGTDLDALRLMIARLAQLVEHVPQITEVEMNPVIALAPGLGCCAVDARIKVGDGS